MNSSKGYSVHQSSSNTLSIVDIHKNAVINRSTFRGTLTNGPIVVGDRCTYITTESGKQKGYVMKLPSGAVIDRFVVKL